MNGISRMILWWWMVESTNQCHCRGVVANCKQNEQSLDFVHVSHDDTSEDQFQISKISIPEARNLWKHIIFHWLSEISGIFWDSPWFLCLNVIIMFGYPSNVHVFTAETPIPGACTATSRFMIAASGAMRSPTKRCRWIDPAPRGAAGHIGKSTSYNMSYGDVNSGCDFSDNILFICDHILFHLMSFLSGSPQQKHAKRLTSPAPSVSITRTTSLWMSSQQNRPVTAFRKKVFEGTEDVLKRQVPTAAHAGLADDRKPLGLDGGNWMVRIAVVQVGSHWVHIETISKMRDNGSFHVDMQLNFLRSYVRTMHSAEYASFLKCCYPHIIVKTMQPAIGLPAWPGGREEQKLDMLKWRPCRPSSDVECWSRSRLPGSTRSRFEQNQVTWHYICYGNVLGNKQHDQDVLI